MGTYYVVACDDLREHIDPGNIDDLGVKAGAISNPQHPFGAVVIFALRTRWFGKTARLVDDCGSDPAFFNYRDATEEVLSEYNTYHKTAYSFTGN
jgi:hypothetical protein